MRSETLRLFENLYYETYNDVLKYVICNCSNIQDAKDIVQNVYVEVLKKIKRNDIVKMNRSFVIGIAKNKIKDYYRFKFKNKIISLFSSKNDLLLINNVSSDCNLQDDFIKEEDLKLVWQYLKKKNVIISKIFYLYYYMNFSIKDISKALNMSEANVKNYLYRTLKELRLLLKVGGGDDV